MKREEIEKLAEKEFPIEDFPFQEDVEFIEHQRQAYTKGIEKGLELKRDYTKEDSFWKRLEAFVKNVQVNDPMSEEEKETILRQCELKTKQRR